MKWWPRIRRSLLPIAITMAAISGVASAQSLTDQQQAILDLILVRDRTPTEEEHALFWADFSPEERSKWEAAASSGNAPGEVFLQEIRYELEAMRAAVTSRAARRLSIEPGLEEVRAKMLHRADDQSEIDNLKAMFERDDQEIAAAAQLDLTTPDLSKIRENMRSALASGHRWSVCLRGPNCPEAAIARLESRIHRAQRLLNPVWDDRRTDWPYPQLHLTLRWSDPMPVSGMGSLPNPTDWLVMVRNDVLRLRGESLPVRGDDSSELRLYFILLDVDEEIESRLRSVNGARAGGRKATVLISREEDWRGRKTVYDVQSSVLHDRTRYFASRLVYAPEHGGAWYLQSDARDSAERAQQLLVELEDAVRLQ